MAEETLDQRQAQARQLFQALVGSWEGTNQTWFEPGVLADTSPVRGTIRQLGDSHFVVYEYQSSMKGDTFQGVVLYGFNSLTGLFESAWADTFHMQTNMMNANGPAIDNGFAVLGSFQPGPDQPAWGWRTEVTLLDPDHLTITAFIITPQGDEGKGVETTLQRVAT